MTDTHPLNGAPPLPPYNNIRYSHVGYGGRISFGEVDDEMVFDREMAYAAIEIAELKQQLEAANARITALEVAQEWRPTHRNKSGMAPVRVLEVKDGLVFYDFQCIMDNKMVIPQFTELYGEPLPDVGEKEEGNDA